MEELGGFNTQQWAVLQRGKSGARLNSFVRIWMVVFGSAISQKNADFRLATLLALLKPCLAFRVTSG